RFGAVIFNKVAEVTILALAHRTIQTDGVPADLEDAARLLDADVGRAGGFLDSRLAAHFLEQLFRDVAQLAHRLDHVHRDADRAGLVGDGARDRLAYPPGGVGAELVAAPVFVLVHRPHQAGVAFLDQ